MTAKALAEDAPNTQNVEAPYPLRLVEAASTSALDDQSSVKSTKGTPLGSLKLRWIDQITSDTGAPDAAVRVGLVIARHINDRSRRAWPKLTTIACQLGRKERSVRDSVHALADRQHLGITKRGSGNLNQYELLQNGLTVEERDRAQIATAAAGKAASRKPEAEARGAHAEQSKVVSAFERFMAVFPHRDHAGDRGRILAMFERCLKDGITTDTILSGAEAFREFCDEKGITGTGLACEADVWLSIQGWRAVDPSAIPPDDEDWL